MRRATFLILLVLLAAPSRSRADDQITNQWQAYSPSLIEQNHQVVMYYSGLDMDQLAAFKKGIPPRDTIYRSICTSPANCTEEKAILSPQEYGMGSLDDPSVVNTGRGSLIMYMTGVASTRPNAGNNVANNRVYYSTTTDGVNWSAPRLILKQIFLPSATLAPAGIFVYGNSNKDGTMHVYNMGFDGLTRKRRKLIRIYDPSSGEQIGNNYTNLDVIYSSQYKSFLMFGLLGQSQIDYLTSDDGKNFYLQKQNIVPLDNPAGRSALWPASYCSVYYGQNVNGSWNIFLHKLCAD